MKSTQTILITGAILFCSYQTFSQCKMMGMSHSGHDNHETAVLQSQETVPDTIKTTYTCSMHPEIKMDKPGDCPKCGMALIAVKEEAKNEVKAVYQCPMKCEGDKTYDKAGSCPVCNMNLEKVEHHEHSEHKH